VLDTVIGDAVVRNRGRIVYAGVARDSLPSLRLLTEAGLIHELPHPDNRYINRLGILA